MVPKILFMLYVAVQHPACLGKSNNSYKQRWGREIFQLFNYAPITERSQANLRFKRIRMLFAVTTMDKFKILVSNTKQLKGHYLRKQKENGKPNSEVVWKIRVNF